MGGVTDPHISVVSTPPKLGAQMRIHGGGTSGGHRPQYQIPPPHTMQWGHTLTVGGEGAHIWVCGNGGGFPAVIFGVCPPCPPPNSPRSAAPAPPIAPQCPLKGGGPPRAEALHNDGGGGGELGCTPHKSRPPPQQMGYGPPPNTMNAFGLQLHAGELRQNSAAVGGEGVLGGALESPPQDPPLPR